MVAEEVGGNWRCAEDEELMAKTTPPTRWLSQVFDSPRFFALLRPLRGRWGLPFDVPATRHLSSCMITPSPTAKIDPTLARGTLAGVVAESATRKGFITLAVPNTSYEMHLIPTGAIPVTLGKRLLGVIKARARRIDVVQSGGRYVEPVMGHPRRVQGTVVRIEGEAVVVDAGVPIHLTPTDARQGAGQFQPGQFVSCDVMDGATFTAKA